MEVKLAKMKVELKDEIRYSLSYAESGELNFNDLIGREVTIRHNGLINCSVCDKKIPKVFGQGFCYPCFMNAPENSECIIRPELCEGHLGKGRDAEWEERNHNQEHIVYLALTSAIKIGVTRKSNLVSRWIDQGAWKAIILAEVPYRRLAGEIEVAMKEFITDKTNWRKMLKNEMFLEGDLLAMKDEMAENLDEMYHHYISPDDEIITLNYPVTEYPAKVVSLNLDKNPEVKGVLKGIRGQYLIFDEGRVFNVRKHTGYTVDLQVGDQKESTQEAIQTTLF